MMKCCKALLFFFCFSFAQAKLFAQACTTLGQTPSTAFPVCGTSVFQQKDVPECGGTKLTAPCTMGTGSLLSDKNPFWYKFTCYTAGTLGFTITPTNLGDDYDWQLWDITGVDPNEVFTNSNLFVACNWSGKTGVTGSSAQGTAAAICGDQQYPGVLPLFTAMPALKKDHQYLLMISHFDGATQSGYQLKFEGGTANITDPTDPSAKSVSSGCDAMSVRVKLNKNMKCTSIAPDGSDFTISGNPVITSAKGNNCNNSFDMDEVILTLKDPLPPGKYTVTTKKGTDGNTLKDNCDREVPENQSFEMEILPLIPMTMDSITPVQCEPTVINVVFRRMIIMNTADPSDFSLTGPEARSVVGVKGVSVTNGMSYTVQLQLNAPIQTGGIWNVILKKGIDGNSLIDECGTEVIPGTKSFIAYDTVNANFNTTINYSCNTNTVNFSHNGAHNVNAWQWVFHDNTQSNAQAVTKTYANFSPKQVSLNVSNGVCVDTTAMTLIFDNELDAAFDISTDSLCPGEAVTLTNKTIGNIVGWQWNFNDGTFSTAQTPPPHIFPAPQKTRDYIIQLSATNNYGCTDMFSVPVKALQSCFVAIPTAFTPNGDGLNDFLYPLNGFKASKLSFKVYNRYGQLVFQTTDWNKRWDGKINGQMQPSGTYVWTFDYTDAETQKSFSYRGTTVLIR